MVMTPSGITLATATPRPVEPWDDTDTKFGTRQRIWHYGRNQQTRRHWDAKRGKKKVQPFIGTPDKPTDQWMCHAGHEPWPHYWSHPPEDAFRSLWVLEGEGEKVADYAASAGFVCISHPGHDRSDEALRRRYRELKALVAGVIYLVDHDQQGEDLGHRLKAAALDVGLPFAGFFMGGRFTGLPKGGSLDDVPDVEAAVKEILELLNEDPPPSAQLPSQEHRAEQASPATPADPEDSSAEAPLRKVDDRRAALTYDRLVTPDLGDSLALLTEALPADPVTVVVPFLTGLSGLLQIGTRAGSAADYDQPLNLFSCIVGKPGSGKTPLLNETARYPSSAIREQELKNYTDAVSYWNHQKKDEKGDKPGRLFPVLSSYNPPALSKQLTLHEAQGTGLLLMRDELSGLFSTLAADQKSGTGKAEGQLLELWDGTGVDEVLVNDFRSFERCHFSLVGAIQPERLRELIRGVDPTGKWSRFLFIQMPPGLIKPSREEPTQLALRRRYDAQLVLKACANQARGLQAKTYYLTQEARDIYIPWFQAHQSRAQQLEGSNPIVSSVLDKSSAQFLRLAGLLHLVRYPGRDRIDATTATLAMEVIDCLFAETELFHRGDGDLVDQLMDRIRGFGGDVTWERLRGKGLNRWLKANARARHFGEAVSNLLANAEGELVKTNPLTWTWRR